MIWILAFYIDFEGAKNIFVLEVLTWGFGWYWRFLAEVWDIDFDLDIVTGLLYTSDQNVCSLSLFKSAKNIHIH